MTRWGRTGTVVAVAALVVLVVLLVGPGGADRASEVDPPAAAPSSPADSPTTDPHGTTGSTGATAPGEPTTTATITDRTELGTEVDGGSPDGDDDPVTSVAAAVDRLVVTPDQADLPAYRRAAFGDGWDYDPETACNTRERVLIAEAVRAPTVDDRCRSTGGQWRSPYDGLVTTNPADLEIDHLVPLADAWRSGAWAWTDERRRAFANDLDLPDTLVAVSSHTNRSKGDSTPDEWLPPDPADRCTYVASWVRVKERWELSVTPAEKATLVQLLAGC